MGKTEGIAEVVCSSVVPEVGEGLWLSRVHGGIS